MNIIRLDRGEGKTTMLIKESARLNAPIICMNTFQREYILEVAKKNNLNIPTPLRVGDDLRGYDLKNGILIDDVECVLEKILGVKIQTVTTSSEIFKYNILYVVGRYDCDGDFNIYKSTDNYDTAIETLKSSFANIIEVYKYGEKINCWYFNKHHLEDDIKCFYNSLVTINKGV